MRGVDGHGGRDDRDVHPAVLGRLHEPDDEPDEPDDGQWHGDIDGHRDVG